VVAGARSDDPAARGRRPPPLAPARRIRRAEHGRCADRYRWLAGLRRRAATGLPPPLDRGRRRRDAADRDTGALLPAALARARRRRPRLGPRGAAARAALAAQLGHRRLRRSLGAGRAHGAAGRGCDRPQSAACAVHPQPAACEPLQPVDAAADRRALHRGGSGARLRRMRGGAAHGRRTRVPDPAEGAARRAAGRPRGRGPGQARGAALPVRALRARAPGPRHRARQRPRAHLPFLRGRPRRGAAPPCAVRGAAGAFPCRRRLGAWLDRLARGLARSGLGGGGAVRTHACERAALPPVPAVAGLDAAGGGRRALPSARHARGPVPRPRDLGRPRGLGRLGRPVGVRARRERGRAARRVQSPGPGLGPAAAARRPAAHERLPAVRRHAARQHAPRRRAAHRPRDGADAAVLDSRGQLAARRRLRAVPARGDARDPHAREPPPPLHGDRRGPGHGGAARARGAGAGRRAVVPRAGLRDARQRVPAARRLPGRCARDLRHA